MKDRSLVTASVCTVLSQFQDGSVQPGLLGAGGCSEEHRVQTWWLSSTESQKPPTLVRTDHLYLIHLILSLPKLSTSENSFILKAILDYYWITIWICWQPQVWVLLWFRFNLLVIWLGYLRKWCEEGHRVYIGVVAGQGMKQWNIDIYIFFFPYTFPCKRDT